MDNLLEFDEAFKEIGGLYTIPNSDILNGYIQMAQKIISFYRRFTPLSPTVNFNFIDNYNFQAVASKDRNGKYYIGINIGTYVLIKQLFFRMLSNPRVLPEFGDITVERETNKIFNAQLTNYVSYFLATAPDEEIKPLNRERGALADLLTGHSIMYLMMHEFAHIFFGHLDYVNSLNLSSNYYEMGDNENLDSMVSQTLEYDADAYACKFVVDAINLYKDHIDSISEGHKQFLSDVKISLRLYLFAVSSTFQLFGMKEYDLDNLKKYSHPPSFIRIRNFCAGLYTHYENENKEFIEELLKALREMPLKAAEAFNEISEINIDNSFILKAYDTRSSEHIKNIHNNWKNVRPLVEPYAFGKLAPIQADI